jgi:hypothetical protein
MVTETQALQPKFDGTALTKRRGKQTQGLAEGEEVNTEGGARETEVEEGGQVIGKVNMGNSDPQKMDIEGPALDDLPGTCMSGMAPAENRIPKSDM